MTLSRDAYRALEDIVGPKYVSEEPAILDSYAYQWLAETIRPDQSKFMPRPEAVVIPADTKEVQGIVKVCNKYKLGVKPSASGWYFYAAPRYEGVIQVDLRRMNHIIEIDEKNMYAIIEPGVTAAQLQSEAMKVGLNPTITGAGASCSTLVAAAAYHGTGGSAIFCGENRENLLSVEWVLPNGELLKTGSLGSGCGWFTTEGPGPGARGIVRGFLGPRGGLGIFTRVGVKLAPWPGPTQFPIEGKMPAYRTNLPKNFKAYTICFKDWDSYFEAYYKIYDNEISYFAHRQWGMIGTELGPAFWALYQDPTQSLDNIEEWAAKPEIKEFTEDTKINFTVVIAGMSQRDADHQDRVLDLILEQTGGWKSNKWSEPEMEQFTLLYMLRLGKKNLNFVYNGGWVGAFMQGGTPDFTNKYVKLAMDSIEPYMKKGQLVNCGPDSMMGCVGSIGGGGACGLEQFGFYDITDKESTQACIDWMDDCVKICSENSIPMGKEFVYKQVAMTQEQLNAGYMKSPQTFIWQAKIKAALDPNNLGDQLYPHFDPIPEGK